MASSNSRSWEVRGFQGKTSERHNCDLTPIPMPKRQDCPKALFRQAPLVVAEHAACLIRDLRSSLSLVDSSSEYVPKVPEWDRTSLTGCESRFQRVTSVWCSASSAVIIMHLSKGTMVMFQKHETIVAGGFFARANTRVVLSLEL